MTDGAAEVVGLAGLTGQANGIPQGAELLGIVQQHQAGHGAAVGENRELDFAIGHHHGGQVFERGFLHKGGAVRALRQRRQGNHYQSQHQSHQATHANRLT